MRRLFPRAGPAYELFDSAVFLMVLGLVGYVFTEQTPTTMDALTYVFGLAPPIFWGSALSLTGITGIVCSYNREWVRGGLLIMTVVCILWASTFAVGAVFYAWRYNPDVTLWRVVISVTLYSWIASRMTREMGRWDERQMREARRSR